MITNKYEITLIDQNNTKFVVEVSAEQMDIEHSSDDDELAVNTAIQYLQETCDDYTSTFTLKQLHRIS